MTKNTKTILGWCFYDFANQPFTTIVVTFIYSAYFISGIVVADEAMGQVYWGNAVTVCAIIIALLSPIMGAAADQGDHLPGADRGEADHPGVPLGPDDGPRSGLQ